MSDLGDRFVEELKEVNERQRKCDHKEITWHPMDNEEDIWKCDNCDLHFKPKKHREERFLEWAKDQPFIAFKEKTGDSSED